MKHSFSTFSSRRCFTARRFVLGAGLFAALATLGSVAACKRNTSNADQTLRIAVIPKGTTHEFWKGVHAGAVKASRELKVEVVWKGPLKEDDLKSQIDLVQSFTAQRVAGVVLAPLSDSGLANAVKSATQNHVPVVIIDSALKAQEQKSFVATDNRAAGKLAGTKLAELLQNTGSVLLLRYQEGSASTRDREEGFLEAIRSKGLQVASDNQYGGATTESAFAQSESLLLAQSAAQGKIAGIFCPNESSTFGMLLALRKANLAGKIKFVGFDASEKLLEALKQGHIHGLVVQDPMQMGYLGVKTLVEHLRGNAVPERIDTGSHFVSQDNLADPSIQNLLKPDLKTWLAE